MLTSQYSRNSNLQNRNYGLDKELINKKVIVSMMMVNLLWFVCIPPVFKISFFLGLDGLQWTLNHFML